MRVVHERADGEVVQENDDEAAHESADGEVVQENGDEAAHESADGEAVLASTVDIAEGFFETSRGLMFRSSIPDDYALVFEFEAPEGIFPSLVERLPYVENTAVARRFIHMLFVRFPIDVLWLQGEEVVHTKTLRPWIGLGMGKADRIIELPAGAAEDVAVGDTVVIERPEEEREGDDENNLGEDDGDQEAGTPSP